MNFIELFLELVKLYKFWLFYSALLFLLAIAAYSYIRNPLVSKLYELRQLREELLILKSYMDSVYSKSTVDKKYIKSIENRKYVSSK